MTRVRHDLITRIWRGRDPFLDLPPSPKEVDLNGWHGEHPYLVEVGAGKGGATIVLGRELKSRRIDSAVIAVDTFLGGATEWQSDEAFEALDFEAGHTTLYPRFISNILRIGLGNYVMPLTMDATSAATFLQSLHVHPGVVHLDAGGDYHSLTAQLHAWWHVLAPGGILIGGTYDDGLGDGKRAFDDFFAAHGHLSIEHREGKCRITKPAHASATSADAPPADPHHAPTPPHAPTSETTPVLAEHPPAEHPLAEPTPAAAAYREPEPVLAEPINVAPEIEELPVRRATGSFRLGGRPVQVSDEQERAST